MLFFVWNGEVTEARITAMLEQYAARGVGGVFVHARPGLITEYLSDRWFALWKHALRETKRLRLECHIYDEYPWPSGIAGGHVLATDPRLVAQTLRAVNGGRGEWKTEVVQTPRSLFSAGFGYVDLTRPETTRLFLEKTHEQYTQRFGKEFGRHIKYAFADEPLLAGGDGLAWSAYLAAEFEKEHGYNLKSRLAAFGTDDDAARAVRFDYYWTIQRLFTENYLKPSHNWCAARGLAFTGHFNEHKWPTPTDVPDMMAALRWLQAPGDDLLAFQFTPTGREKNGLYFLNLCELRSVANQLGRERVLCETSGGGGYNFALADFKALEDFAMVNGVNLTVPHLSHQTISGARKYEWPQTISDHSSWWNGYRVQADHVARVQTALLQGRERNRVLVLQPTTTAWIEHRPPSFCPGDEPKAALERIRADHTALLLALQGEHFDFDLGDELIMAELGRVAAGQLRVGAGAYEAVVVPATMDNLLPSTAELLNQFAAAGGQVLALHTPRYVRGRRQELAGWERCGSTADLLAKLRQATPPRFAAPAELFVMRKEVADGSLVYFICNPWDAGVKANVRVEAGSVTALDTLTGEICGSPGGSPSQGWELELPARGHALWVVTKDGPKRRLPAPVRWCEVPVGPVTVERLTDNILAIDYCDLEVNGRTLTSVPTAVADRENWLAQGFEQNVWKWSVQYRRCFLEATPVKNSGFRVRYRFQVAGGCVAELAVERPWLYQITVNGQPVDFTNAKQWWDEDVRRISIGALAREGENVVELAANPFHVLCEIMPVYVLGEFAVESAATGFELRPARALAVGDWRTQGLSFYPWGVRYRLAAELPAATTRWAVQVPRWAGSVIHVGVDGQERGVIACPPGRLECRGEFAAGRHEMTLDVMGNMKNLLGPFFSDGLPVPWSWEASPQPQPAGTKYRFYECGLLAAPQVMVAES